MKILNLYAGIGGNRKLWGDEHEVTAVENVKEIAEIYQKHFPKDKILVEDAHQYLLDHYKEFDFIWTSPPCPTHSRFRLCQEKKVYPDMDLYAEIIFLKWFFKKGKWVVENVRPYYDTLIPHSFKIGRHLFWSNFNVEEIKIKKENIRDWNKEKLAEHHGFPITKRLYLRNCVNPKIGLHIFNCATHKPQLTLLTEEGEE